MRKLATTLQKAALLIMAIILSLGALTMDGKAYMWPTSPSNLNIQTYTLSASSNVNVYSTSSRTSKTGSVYPGDLITVLKAEGDSAYVRYPVSWGTREGWVALSTLSEGKLNTSYSLAMRASGNVKMYRRETGSETIGSISAGDIVYLVYASTRYGDGTGRAQFIYPIGNGKWKMGWAIYNDIENTEFRACGGSAILPDGDYSIKVSNTHRMDGLGGDGTNVHVWETLDVPQQTVHFCHRGNGKYSIEFKCGLYLDQKGGGTASSTLWRYPWNGTDAQLWYVADLGNGAYGLFNVGSGLSMDVYCYQTQSNGSDILAFKFNGQRIYLESTNSVNRGTTSAESQITNRLNNMMNGSYGNGVYKVGTKYTGLYASEQCKGFAKRVHETLFGYNIGSTKSQPNNYQISINYDSKNNTKLVGSLTSLSSQSNNAVKSLFDKAHPGDFIQVRRSHGGSHSMIFLSADSNSVTVYEANVDGNNGIQKATYSYSSFQSSNTAISVYTAVNYYLH